MTRIIAASGRWFVLCITLAVILMVSVLLIRPAMIKASFEDDPDCIGYQATMDTYKPYYEEAKKEYEDAKEKVAKAQAKLDEIWPIYKDKDRLQNSINDAKNKITITEDKLKELRKEYLDLGIVIIELSIMSGLEDAEEDSVVEKFCGLTAGIVACKEWKEVNEKIIALDEDLQADNKALTVLEKKYEEVMKLDEIYWENIKIKFSYDLDNMQDYVNYYKNKYETAEELYELYCL